MNNKFTDLVDIEKIHTLLQSFHRLTGINSSITDTEGNLNYVKDGSLLGGGWTKICVNFHRVHPETCKRCIESDTVLSQKLNEGENYACYECLNGLIDVAVPIKIGDKHIVNLFMGQFFFEKPDKKFFKKQAAQYNFDEAKYLKALSEVPVFSREKIDKALEFLKNLAELIIEMGASHKE